MAVKNNLGFVFSLIFISNVSTLFASDGYISSFNHYPTVGTYAGKVKYPDFKGRDKDFTLFKTRILEGIKEGVNFAGEYSIIQFGCGSGCSNVIAANHRTGELLSFPRGGELNQALTLKFQVDSKLLLARWYTDSLWETCVMEAFVLDGGKWQAISSTPSKDMAVCDAFVPEQ